MRHEQPVYLTFLSLLTSNVMLRVLIAIILAGFITLGLFFTMQALIASGDKELTDPPVGKVLDFVRVPKDESVQKKELKPKRPPKPEAPPPEMEQPQMDSPTPDGEGLGLDFGADVSNDISLDGGLALGSGDGEYLPIVKVTPVDPRRALQRGIQGQARRLHEDLF